MSDKVLRKEIGRRLVIWLALLGLLAATVALTFAPLGPFRLAASLAIAAAKAALIAWVYMDLAKADGRTRLAAASALLFLGVLILLTCLDFAGRGLG